LNVADPVFVNDTLRTGADSSLGVTFDDQTTFSLSADTFIVVDKFLFEPDGKDNAASIFIGKGSAAFVASLVAKTGDMHITMETAVIGIRGTTGVIDIPETGATPTVAPTVKLYPDADGHVGQIEVLDFQGARIGALTQGASAFAIRSAAGGRVTAEPYQIPNNETVRDRGVLQRLTTSHDVGRQMIFQRQQLRAPNRQPNNNQQPGGGRDQRGNDNRPNENRANENKANENKPNEKKADEKKTNETKPNENKANDNKANDNKDRGGGKDRGNDNKDRGRDNNERGQNNERGGRGGSERTGERAGPGERGRPGFERGREGGGPGGPAQSGEMSGRPHGGFGMQGPGGLGVGRGPGFGGGPGRGPSSSGPNPFERKHR
jgi:hypothetical protein